MKLSNALFNKKLCHICVSVTGESILFPAAWKDKTVCEVFYAEFPHEEYQIRFKSGSALHLPVHRDGMDMSATFQHPKHPDLQKSIKFRGGYAEFKLVTPDSSLEAYITDDDQEPSD